MNASMVEHGTEERAVELQTADESKKADKNKVKIFINDVEYNVTKGCLAFCSDLRRCKKIRDVFPA